MQILNTITAPDGRRVGIHPPCLEGAGDLRAAGAKLTDDGLELPWGDTVKLEHWQIVVLRLCWGDAARVLTLILSEHPPPSSTSAGANSWVVRHGNA